MKSYISEDKEFRIIPKDVKQATKCVVNQTEASFFTVRLLSDEKLNIDENIEMFSNTPQGLLYFETSIIGLENNFIKLQYPITHKFLQRREYTRIEYSKNILLKDQDKTIKASIIDISAGGLKLTTPEEMSLAKDYRVNFEVEKNILLDCLFQPIRIEADELHGYTVSGRFKLIKNIARISLVQFCFRKQIENQNK